MFSFLPTLGYTAPTGKPSALPADILLEICRFLSFRSDILHLGLASSGTYDSISAALYNEVTLTTTPRVVTTLNMLSLRPDITRHVRKLTIRPAENSTKSRHSFSSSAFASSAVRDVASTKRLDSLLTFVWDDDEIPFHDEMWFSLRMGCPQLAYISVTFGYYLPSQVSHLYDFSNLRGFCLHLKPDFYRYHGDYYFTDEEYGTPALWSMLQRCGSLEELSIVGVSSVPADVHPVTEHRWPNLRRLQLGDVCVDWLPRFVQSETNKRPFVSFLEAHPGLSSLSLSRSNVQHQHLATIDAECVHLDNFEGTLPQLQSLPAELCSSITSVTFSEPLQTREINGFTLAGVLQGMACLQELRISFSLHCMYYDSSSLLRSLISGAPQLQHLELACLQRPSFQIESFSKTIRGFPKLRSLHLMIVKYPGDDNLSAGAARLAKMNPRVKKFRLTYLAPSATSSPPFGPSMTPVSYSSKLSSEPEWPSLAKSTGSFAVTTDSYGLPLLLNARVRSRFVWPCGLGESSKTRLYSSDLRPAGTPGTHEQRLLSLFFERSPAGEEMRMFAFCGILVVLAVFGFWTGTTLSTRLGIARP